MSSTPSLPGQAPLTPQDYPLCTCFQVTEEEIEKTVRVLGLRSIGEITHHTRAGAGCHTCWPDLVAILTRCTRGEFRFPISDLDRRRILQEAAVRRAVGPGGGPGLVT